VLDGIVRLQELIQAGETASQRELKRLAAERRAG
jgi:hypothetical protein